MAANVIDALVVTLGLDSKGFAEGVKGSSEQLAGFTRKLIGMFVAVRSIEDVVGYFKDLHAQLAEIGFTSKNLGVAGTELKKLGEVSELFGGQMSDAADSVAGLQSAVFGLRFKGQMSESLMMLQRFGVAYLDAAGHARNFRDIAKDAAAAIERQAKVAGLDKGERFQLAQSMGFTGGIASAVAQGGKGLEDALGKAQVDQAALTEKTIQGQVRLDEDLTRLHEATAAQSSVILARLTPALERATQWLAKLANELLPKIVHAIDMLIAFFKNPPPWFKSIKEGAGQLADLLGPIGTLVAALGALTLALSVGGALIGAIAGIAPAVALGVGLGTAIAHLKSGGLLDKINEKMLDFFGPGSEYNPNKDASGKPIAGTQGGARAGSITRAPATPTAPRARSAAEQSAAAGGATPTARNGGGTQVQIDKIEVNTRATDADGIAADMNGAMQRKLLVADADQGIG